MRRKFFSLFLVLISFGMVEGASDEKGISSTSGSSQINLSQGISTQFSASQKGGASSTVLGERDVVHNPQDASLLSQTGIQDPARAQVLQPIRDAASSSSSGSVLPASAGPLPSMGAAMNPANVPSSGSASMDIPMDVRKADFVEKGVLSSGARGELENGNILGDASRTLGVKDENSYREVLGDKFGSPLLEDAPEKIEKVDVLPRDEESFPGHSLGEREPGRDELGSFGKAPLPSQAPPSSRLGLGIVSEGGGSFSRPGRRILREIGGWSGTRPPREGRDTDTQNGGTMRSSEWRDRDGLEHRFSEHRDADGHVQGYVHSTYSKNERGVDIEVTVLYGSDGEVSLYRRTHRSADGGVVVEESDDNGETFHEVWVQKGTQTDGGEKDETPSEGRGTVGATPLGESGWVGGVTSGSGDGDRKTSSETGASENQSETDSKAKEDTSDSNDSDDDKDDKDSDEDSSDDENKEDEDSSGDDKKSSSEMGPDLDPLDPEGGDLDGALMERVAPWQKELERDERGEEQTRRFGREEEGQPGAEGTGERGRSPLGIPEGCPVDSEGRPIREERSLDLSLDSVVNPGGSE
ncbi:MAG: hypothetical protein HYS08_10090 [Chlamydiae bacterium]|nr:hypothetical protein [Chlamydiota bacterium]